MKRIGSYEILQKLGEGASGKAYLAHDPRLARDVVVKVLHRTSPEDRARLLQEARLASAIDHPNVCAVYRVSEDEGRPYLVMQYVHGRTLRDLLQDGPLSLPLLLAIGQQIAAGLDAAHRLGILHRDLKPANVMIRDDGRVKILDFGLADRYDPPSDDASPDTETTTDEAANATNTRTANGAARQLGTVAYMAPELFVTFRTTEQSDVFALGVMLYEMATGRHPFQSSHTLPEHVRWALQNSTPEPVARLRPDLPPTLAAVIERAMARQPAERYRAALDVCEALAAVQRDLDEAPPAPAPVPPPPPVERSGGLLGFITDRFRTEQRLAEAVLVAPFQGLAATTQAQGLLMAEAIAARLARQIDLDVRPPSVVRALGELGLDPQALGHRVQVRYVLYGTYAPQGTTASPGAGAGLLVTWHLLDAEDGTVRAGGLVPLSADRPIAGFGDLADAILAALPMAGLTAAPPARAALPDDLAESYHEARALLARFDATPEPQATLDQALGLFDEVLQAAPDHPEVHAGYAVTLVRLLQNGSGTTERLLDADHHLQVALAMDPDLHEARLYHAYTLFWKGEKDQARRDVQVLLDTQPLNADVWFAAGLVLQADGLLDEALHAFARALQLDPHLAARIYHYRARLYLYKGDLDRARAQVDKGLNLEPTNAILKTTLGYWNYRARRYHEAIDLLEGIIREEARLRLARPTLALCYAATGQPERAQPLLTERLLNVARADGEIAYRLASAQVALGQIPEALEGLRRALYLGNQNYPWFSMNPTWAPLHDHPEFRTIMADLERLYRANRARWDNLRLKAA